MRVQDGYLETGGSDKKLYQYAEIDECNGFRHPEEFDFYNDFFQ